jgi:hypothetical protein
MVTHLSRWERIVGRLPWPISRYFSAYLIIKVSRRRGWPYSLWHVLLEATFGLGRVWNGHSLTDTTSRPLIPLRRILNVLDRPPTKRDRQ